MSLIKMPASKFWYARFMFNGKLNQFSTKTTNKNKAQLIHDKRRADLIDQHHLGTQESITIGEALSLFVESKKNDTTFSVHECFAKKLLGSVWDSHKRKVRQCYGLNKNKLLHDIKTSDIDRLIVNRKNDGLAMQTIMHEMNTLTLTLNMCRRLGYAIPNISIKEIKQANNVKKRKPFIRFLTQDEERRLLEEVDPENMKLIRVGKDTQQWQVMYKSRTDLRDLVVLLLDLGCRHTEATSLTWDNIDFEKKTIKVRREKVRNETYLCMTERCYQIMKERYERRNPEQPFVFLSRTGEGKRGYSKFAFQNAVERAGLEGVTFHTLRKTLASRLVQNGATLVEIQQILGHSSPTMTAMYYADLAPSVASARAVEILNNLQGNTL